MFAASCYRKDGASAYDHRDDVGVDSLNDAGLPAVESKVHVLYHNVPTPILTCKKSRAPIEVTERVQSLASRSTCSRSCLN